MSETIVRGSELTRELLKRWKYVLCLVSHISDDSARKYKELTVIEYVDGEEGWFTCVDGDRYNHAVPIDNNGNEIVRRKM